MVTHPGTSSPTLGTAIGRVGPQLLDFRLPRSEVVESRFEANLSRIELFACVPQPILGEGLRGDLQSARDDLDEFRCWLTLLGDGFTKCLVMNASERTGEESPVWI